MRMRTMLLGFLMAGLLLAGSLAPAGAAENTAPTPPSKDARPDPHGSSYGMNLSPEKRSALQALFREQREKTFPLREQLWAKKTTLHALQNNPKTDPQQLITLVNEISALRSKLHAERVAFEDKVRKDFGIDAPFFFHGKGAYGRGPGEGGFGCEDGGYGHGPRGHGSRGHGGWGHRGGMMGGDYR